MVLTTHLDAANAQRSGRCVATRVSILLESVQQFSGVVGTFVSSHPAIAALVWGSVQLMLQLASNSASYFDKLSSFLMNIGQNCPRFSEYKLIFQDATRLQTSLCNYFAEIVRLCTHVCEVLRKPSTTFHSKTYTWASFDSEFGHFRESIGRLAKEVRAEISLASEQAANDERSAQVSHRTTVGRYLRRNEQAESEARERTSRLLLWNSAFLVGCGKTLVIANTIASLFSCHPANTTGKTYFFCRYNDEQSLSATTILRSLIRQCLNAASLIKDTVDCLTLVLAQPLIEGKDLQKLLELSTSTFSAHYIVIDGIDDCAKSERRVLLETLSVAVRSSKVPIKLLISSRMEATNEINQLFRRVHTISISTLQFEADVSTYVDSIISKKLEHGDFMVGDSALLLQVTQVLIAKAEGMFLWVALQIDEICRQVCDRDIRKALNELPKGLTETYNRMLSRIFNNRHDRVAKQVFEWAAVAKRPLLLSEMREAIAVEPFAAYSKPDRLIHDFSRIIQWTEGLVSIDELSDEVRFAHSTIKLTLMDPIAVSSQPWSYIAIDEADKEAGVICATYLNFNDFKTELIKRPAIHGFTGRNVARAISSANMSPRIADALLKLGQRGTGRPKTDINILQKLSEVHSTHKKTVEQDRKSRHPFLTYASEHWLSHSASFRKRDQIWSLWQNLVVEEDLAVKPWSGHDWLRRNRKLSSAIVQFDNAALFSMIQNSASPFPNHERSWILCSAAFLARLKLIDTALGIDSDNNIYVAEVINPVARTQSSARDGDASAVENSLVGETSQTALQAAAEGGHLEVVERLLAAKADANAPPPAGLGGRTALQAAAQGGHLEVVKRLLSAGAFVSTTVLQAAVGGEHKEIVQVLREGKANMIHDFT
ncbi:hypothetical protein K431DRAFT_215605 [Polychaeton citri CBS 116435]|uniref:NACHT domain-containing protein n=1 Tax=Polychaeton citri CBS 116435 TaxID=1314669 RepID=A0A9P4QDX4_9PEZI|nr:hypothetical protein K431DRAFT_215605 [Polychaeton citri CBS 116435]